MSNLDQYAREMGLIESTNRPNVINRLGYAGLYQMGTGALVDAGYMRKPSNNANRHMENPNMWTGKDGIRSLEDFLNNQRIQKKALLEYTSRNKKVLEGRGVIKPTSTSNEIYGHLAGAHLLGASGYSDDPKSKDANKVSGLKYYNKMQKHKWKNESEVNQEDDSIQSIDLSTLREIKEEDPLTPEEIAELSELEEWERNNEQK